MARSVGSRVASIALRYMSRKDPYVLSICAQFGES